MDKGNKEVNSQIRAMGERREIWGIGEGGIFSNYLPYLPNFPYLPYRLFFLPYLYLMLSCVGEVVFE